MVARWRIFQTPINAEPEKVEKIVFACIALHNYLKQTDNAYYTPKGMLIRKAVRRIVPGQWWSSIETNSIQNIRPVRGSKYTKTAVQTREKLTEHLVAGGSVSWQWDYIRRTGNEED